MVIVKALPKGCLTPGYTICVVPNFLSTLDKRVYWDLISTFHAFVKNLPANFVNVSSIAAYPSMLLLFLHLIYAKFLRALVYMTLLLATFPKKIV